MEARQAKTGEIRTSQNKTEQDRADTAESRFLRFFANFGPDRAGENKHLKDYEGFWKALERRILIQLGLTWLCLS